MTEEEQRFYDNAKDNFLRNNSGLQYTNVYGQFGPKGEYKTHSYACHAKLNNDEPMSQIIVSAIYNGSAGWPVEEQSLYFEYILDKETSPWRDLIDILDLEVIRLDGCVAWVIVRNLSVNKFAMFHFLKGFRQILERQHAIKIFTDQLKKASEEERRSFSMYKKFLLSHLFQGVGSVVVSWGHDHHCFRGRPLQNVIDKKVVADLKSSLFIKGKYYYSHDLNQQTWGGYVSSREFNPEVPIITALANAQVTAGNIFDMPTSGRSLSISVERLSADYDGFIKRYEEHFGEIKQTPQEESKEKAA